MEALPKGWIKKTTGELFNTQTGNTPPKNVPSYYGEGIPLVKPPELRGGAVNEAEDSLTHVGAEIARILPACSVMVSCIGNLGKVGINTIPVAFNQQINAIIPYRALAIPLFVFYQVSFYGYRQQLEKLSSATTIAIINKKKFDSIHLKIAPINEQHRIVEKIETLFARLEKGEETLREVQKQLARYRQSVLKAAVSGQLTADWRAENAHRLEHGRDLLARILQTRRETWEGRGKYKEPAAPDTNGLPELPEGWVWASLGQLVFRIEAGKNFRCEERPPVGDEIGVVKISAVTWDEFNELESKTILRSEQVNASCQINEGDLLISRANTIELVGASVVVQNISKRLQLSDKVLRLRCVAPIEYWLNYVLKSPLGRLQIEMMATGAQMSMRNISQKNLDRIAIPLPPLDELDFIVDEIRRTRMQGDHLLELCKSELTRSTSLRQSILKDAFAGRLVPQDPNAEPASELLARIRAERAAGPKKRG